MIKLYISLPKTVEIKGLLEAKNLKIVTVHSIALGQTAPLAISLCIALQSEMLSTVIPTWQLYPLPVVHALSFPF